MWFDPIQSVASIVLSLISEGVIVILSIFFAHFIKEKWEKRHYGGWKVIIRQHGENVSEVDISFRKAKEILQVPEELQVFLKGIASPFGWINCNLITEGRERGVLIEDRRKKQFIIDFDKNPPPDRPEPTPDELMATMQRLQGMLAATLASTASPSAST